MINLYIYKSSAKIRTTFGGRVSAAAQAADQVINPTAAAQCKKKLVALMGDFLLPF